MTEATSSIQYIRPDAPLPPASRRRGVRTEAWTPASLDLAERARLAVNGMVEPTDSGSRLPRLLEGLFSLQSCRHVSRRFRHRYNAQVPRSGSSHAHYERLRAGPARRAALAGGAVAHDRPDGQVASPVVGPGLVRPSVPGGLEGNQMIDQQVNGIALGVAATCAALDDSAFWEPIGRGIVDGLHHLVVQHEDMAYLTQWVFAPGQARRSCAAAPVGHLCRLCHVAGPPPCGLLPCDRLRAFAGTGRPTVPLRGPRRLVL